MLELYTGGLSKVAVMAAFRRLVKLGHPDVGRMAYDMARLVAAKNLLLSDKAPCAQCKGRGTVVDGVRAQTCARCEGEGEI